MEGTDLQKSEALKAIDKIVKFNAFLQMILNKRSNIQYKLGAVAIRTYFDENYCDFSINLDGFWDKSHYVSRHTYIPTVWVH
jgi:hypothetical protein